MTGRRLKENVVLFKTIKKLPTKERSLVIKYLSDDGVLRFLELIMNIMEGRVNLKPSDILYLRKYKSVLRNLIQSKKALNQKRAVLSQKGGLLGALLSIGASLLPTVIEQVVKAVK